MGERKVINKYYPPDFDPSKIPRRRKRLHNQQLKITMMLPMRIQCKTCSNYMGEGKKFNSRKEIASGETYLGIKIIIFYFKCSNCSSEIVMKTDPQNSSYVIESGARQCYEFQEFDSENSVIKVKDSMEELEKKSLVLKREMEMVNTLGELQSLKSIHETVSFDEMFRALQEKKEKKLEKEDEEYAKSIDFIRKQNFIQKICDEEFDDDDDYDVLKRRKGFGGEFNVNPTDELIRVYFSNVKVASRSSGRVRVSAKPKLVSGFKNLANQEENERDEDRREITGSGLQSLCENYQSDED